jgi:hypothetical protein
LKESERLLGSHVRTGDPLRPVLKERHMTRRTGSLVAVILVAAQLLVLAPDGHASVVLEFTCSGTFPQWPTSGDTVDCSGSARHVDTAGTICFAGCAFNGQFQSSGMDCSVPGFSPLNTYWLHTGSDSYLAMVVGTHVTYYKGSIPVGEGELVPLPPIPTCVARGPMSFTLTGRIVQP